MAKHSKLGIKYHDQWRKKDENGKKVYRQLEEEDVRQVIEMFPYLNDQQIAQQFQVPRDEISNIRMGRTWKHITKNLKR